MVWVKGQWKPILSYKFIAKGKNKNKIEVLYPNSKLIKKIIVQPDETRGLPEQTKVEEKNSAKAGKRVQRARKAKF